MLNLSDVLSQLRYKGIKTISEFLSKDPKETIPLTNVSDKEMIAIRNSLLRDYMKMESPVKMLQIEQLNIVSTGIPSLDSLLQGGLYPGHLYELCGSSWSGKSQLCMTISAEITARNCGLVRYIDTKKDFCASRIEQILLNRCYNEQNILHAVQRIKTCEVYDKYCLLNGLQQLWKTLPKEEKELRTRVIIVDSLSMVLRDCIQEENENCYLSRLASICRILAKEFCLSVIIVNLITDPDEIVEIDPSSLGTARSQFRVAALGQYWLQVPNARLLLEETRKEEYQLTLWRSSYQEIGLKCTLCIGDAGVT